MKLTSADWSGISAVLYGLVGGLAVIALGNIVISLNTGNVFLCVVASIVLLALASMAKDKSLVEAEWEDEGAE